MSSNDQNASVNQEHASHQQKVAGSAATSDVDANIQSITQEHSSIDIVENDSDIERSSNKPMPTSEIKTPANSNEATKSCQSPKDTSTCSTSSNSTLSSEHSASSNNTIANATYQSLSGSNQLGQDGAENHTQNVSIPVTRIQPDSPTNSRISSANYANRNINDRNVSFGNDHTGQSPVSRYRPQKYCAVCGDKAIACNFNAVTCESCKAFFRRNAFKEQRLKCLFDGRCVVDKVTRRFCSKCRLLKCFQIGMKREWILTDEQKQIKRVKILQNKQSKHHQQQQQVSTSVLDVSSRPRSSGSATSATGYAPHSAEESKPDMLIEEGKYVKRQRTSSSSNYDAANAGRVQKCDASTSCPDEADLLSGRILNYCTMAHQCQYCSLRLRSHVQPLHPVEQYPASYRFHPSHRQYFDYNQRQQTADYHQQQQHFRYGQHAGSHHYASPQAPNSGAYSQQQQMATATALRTNADVMNAAYVANIANGSAADATQPPAGASQQAVSGVACAVAQAAPNCCCPSFSEIFQSQHCNRPAAAVNPVAGPPPLTSSSSSSIIDHFAHHSPNGSNGSCGSGGQLVYTEAQDSINLLSATLVNKSNSAGQQGNTGTIEDSMQPTESAISNLQPQTMANGDISADEKPFVKALSAQRTSLKVPSTSIDLVVSGNSSIDQNQSADSSTSNGCVTVRSNGSQRQAESEASDTPDTVNAIQATKLAISNKQTLPDGTPLDISKHVVWNGVVYAQPAIAPAEMRARIEMVDFTETERQLVHEMIDATKFMFEPTQTDRSFNEDSLNDFVYFCDAALRRLIKTVKQIRAFRILSMDDQIMLLKTACFKILLLRSCLHYHDDIEGWRDRQGRIMPLSLLKKAKSMVYDKHKEILIKLAGPLRKDRLIMGFMSMILLFDPQDNLKHTNSVGLDNLIYLCVLRKYLIATQPDPLEKYERLVDATQIINVCNEEYNVFFSRNFQPEQITPLLIEIFDISINNSV